MVEIWIDHIWARIGARVWKGYSGQVEFVRHRVIEEDCQLIQS